MRRNKAGFAEDGDVLSLQHFVSSNVLMSPGFCPGSLDLQGAAFRMGSQCGFGSDEFDIMIHHGVQMSVHGVIIIIILGRYWEEKEF